jgi:RNA polymerase sigma-70 factor, ECF subfamily
VPARARTALPADEELVTRLRAGDEAAFVLLLDDWSSGMLRLARSFVATADSAAEVVQDTWLAVIENIDRFEGRSALKTWVYRILVNAAKRRRVRELRIMPMSSLGRDALTGLGDGAGAGGADQAGPSVDPDRFQGAGESYPGHWRRPPTPWTALPRSPEQSTLDGELRARLEEALAGLPDRQRLVIIMRDVQGAPAEEVCAVLDLSAANQRVLLHRARASVRARLEAYLSERA